MAAFQFKKIPWVQGRFDFGKTGGVERISQVKVEIHINIWILENSF